VVKDGTAEVPVRPGLGLEWDEAALRRWAADV
jgi:mandelate racemase